jgi:hypothetical protein
MQAQIDSRRDRGAKPTKRDLEVLRHFARFPSLGIEEAVVVSHVPPRSVAERLRRLVDRGLLCFPRSVPGIAKHLLFPRVLAITPDGLRAVQRAFPRQRLAPAVAAAEPTAKRSTAL